MGFLGFSGDSSESYSLSDNSSKVDDRIKLTYAETVVSLATAFGLVIIVLLDLLYRSTFRHAMLLRVQRETRFDGAYILGKPEGSRARIILENGLKTHAFRISDPPQYSRVVPAVVSESRDAKKDCVEMLSKVRTILAKSYGRCAELMSMRCCLACVTGALPAEQSERFLRIYERVMFCSHRVNGDEKLVTSDDIRYMHAFFYNNVLKVLQ
ncbi:conserved hypothetical protein [Leishmania braziliensis MHOM/BR/75/M2904]|uniref:Uncharacterized protein n=2 Tax=Leishmania braziliensis TaxID=5660 RepID=A4HNR3_LEIBR|nr:conserved hypothetical protein [Leishmania braziliensis MHOM/BR/75/M2904]KAI5691134.1 hypothetical protein MNV84_07830 [Leishmania braziliensis]CAJ2481213.1 unnamed protein product [Leishmania braziliensis]CAJ2481479.1 unnamed protein product [Leishmania braziliensis]CAM43816.1 conserved hypothetical protein [Leishmania braziliensis MHOM/BR/75/M2904]SYZ69874.1 hypothetical_protein [Leishmania braziliensis MHOM/BR/75/M2904]